VSKCWGCEKTYPASEVAPVIRFADGTIGWACRRCIGDWINEGFLYAEWPFWARKEGRDVQR
jgi:hypothetical protein